MEHVTEALMREVHDRVCIRAHSWWGCNERNIRHPAKIDWQEMSQAVGKIVNDGMDELEAQVVADTEETEAWHSTT